MVRPCYGILSDICRTLSPPAPSQMMVILLNCLTLGLYRPCEDGPHCSTYRCWLLSLADHAIFAYFAIEMVRFFPFLCLSFSLPKIVKIVALGFFGDMAYLGDSWNQLDFFIVLAGCPNLFEPRNYSLFSDFRVAEYLLQEYLGNINLTAIRTIRVLRPLRAVNRIPSMRILGE